MEQYNDAQGFGFKRSGVYPHDPNAPDYGTNKGTYQIRSLRQNLLKLDAMSSTGAVAPPAFFYY